MFSLGAAVRYLCLTAKIKAGTDASRSYSVGMFTGLAMVIAGLMIDMVSIIK